MDLETYKYMCYSLAKAYTTGVRLYENKTPLYYYSLYHIEPDPVGPYLQQIIDSEHEVGIITTPLYQFYAFLTLRPGLRVIIGPTSALQGEGKAMDELLAVLQVEQDERENYVRWLCSAPVISVDRLAWLMVSLATVLLGKEFPAEKVWIDIKPESSQQSIKIEYAEDRMNNLEDMGRTQAVRQSYRWEQLVSSYIERGQTVQLRELFGAPPKVYIGRMAHDGLRQMKNIGVCTVTGASRAAIRGGLNLQQAYYMADLYIQKIELMQDISNVERLIREMIFDFAEEVEKLRCPTGNESTFYRVCVQYIAQNIFSMIRIESMAKELGYSRTYLCTRFKRETGISVTGYIHREKVEEAKRLLQFGDRKLTEIASLLSFSSQSHFQTVFKKVTGETPLAYRKRMKIME